MATLTKKRILITGVSGLLGNNLAYYFRKNNTVLGLYGQHRVAIPGIEVKDVNITDPGAVKAVIRKFNPDVVFHCAAITDIDHCERDQDLAYRVNTLGTRHVVRALAGTGAQLVHLSTDAVYAGDTGEHKETDRLTPRSFYAKTKCLAEKEALKYKNAIVVRTSFYGWNLIPREKKSLAEVILEHLQNGKRFKGFTDVHTGIIYTFDLASLLEAATRKGLRGVYNFVCRDSATKYEFAVKIARAFGRNESLIDPITIDKSHLTARRSKNLTLSTAKLAKALKIKIPKLEESLRNFHRDFKEGLPQVLRDGLLAENYPRLDIIPYGRQSIDDEDIAAVVDVLKSSNITQGPKVVEFESQLCEITGAKFAVAVNSGTSALHLACLAAGVKPGDEVITSPITFVASANCAVYCGARPVFADIEPRIINIDPQQVQNRLNAKTKAVIPVHFAGQSADMQSIRRITETATGKFGHKIYVIEDGSHALGSRYRNNPVGSCAFSDMTILSFHPVKHITTGEGGAVMTNDEELFNRLKLFRSHGITSTPDNFHYPDEAFSKTADGKSIRDPWYYEQQVLGHNYRITDIQCALGLSQLKKLNVFRQRRKDIFVHYQEVFRELPQISLPVEEKDRDNNLHLYVLQIDFEKIGISRAELMVRLREKSILTQVHYIPVHLQPFYRRNFGYKPGDFPVAEEYYKRCLSLPFFPAMQREDVLKVTQALKEILGAHKWTLK